MIAQQRRGDVEGEPLAMGALLKKPGPGLFFIPTPLGTIRVTKKMIYKIIAGIIFVTLLNVSVVDGIEANRCFAILMFCTFLWATEVRPLLGQVVTLVNTSSRLSPSLSRLCLCLCYWSVFKLFVTSTVYDCLHQTPPSTSACDSIFHTCVLILW